MQRLSRRFFRTPGPQGDRSCAGRGGGSKTRGPVIAAAVAEAECRVRGADGEISGDAAATPGIEGARSHVEAGIAGRIC